MRLYIKVLNELSQVHSFPTKYKRFRTRLVNDLMEMTGSSSHRIINKVSGTIDRASNIAVGDPVAFNELKLVNEKLAPNPDLINQGKLYIFSSGSYGSNIQLRIIDGTEPILTENEFKCLWDVGSIAIINVPSGIICAGGIFELDSCDQNKSSLSVQVEPGFYKVTVFGFVIPHKIEIYYIVCCKTDELPVNQLTKIDEIVLPGY